MGRRKESETEVRMEDYPTSPSSGSPAFLIPDSPGLMISISPRTRGEKDANDSFQANSFHFHLISQIQIFISILLTSCIILIDVSRPIQIPLNVALQRQHRQHKLKLAGLSLLLVTLVAILLLYVYFVHGQLFNGPEELGGGGILLLGGGILATATFGLAAYLTCWYYTFHHIFLFLLLFSFFSLHSCPSPSLSFVHIICFTISLIYNVHLTS